MNTRRTTLLIAIILAIGTGWLTLTYLSSLRPPQNQLAPVLIATQEIPAREKHHRDDVSHVRCGPPNRSNPTRSSNPNQAIGSLRS